jgi:hypothetical protein
MTSTAQFLAWCAQEVGYTEGPAKNQNRYAAIAGHADRQPWCATFLVAAAKSTGLVLPSYSAYTPTMASAFRANARWHSNPLPGDFVFFDFPDTVRRIQHVGVVESNLNGVLRTIEGNTSSGVSGSQYDGGGVYRRTRTLTSVVGFGRPDYEEDVDVTPEQDQRIKDIRAEQDRLANAIQKLWDAEIKRDAVTDARLTRIEQAVATPAGSDTVALVAALQPLLDLAQRLED